MNSKFIFSVHNFEKKYEIYFNNFHKKQMLWFILRLLNVFGFVEMNDISEIFENKHVPTFFCIYCYKITEATSGANTCIP